jgi:hypothetical protein
MEGPEIYLGKDISKVTKLPPAESGYMFIGSGTVRNAKSGPFYVNMLQIYAKGNVVVEDLQIGDLVRLDGSNLRVIGSTPIFKDYSEILLWSAFNVLPTLDLTQVKRGAKEANVSKVEVDLLGIDVADPKMPHVHHPLILGLTPDECSNWMHATRWRPHSLYMIQCEKVGNTSSMVLSVRPGVPWPYVFPTPSPTPSPEPGHDKTRVAVIIGAVVGSVIVVTVIVIVGVSVCRKKSAVSKQPLLQSVA